MHDHAPPPPRRRPHLIVAFLTFVIGVVSIGGGAPAYAATQQATVLSPINGRVTSHPSGHHVVWGWYGYSHGDWSEDIAAGAGTPVYARFSEANGPVSLRIASVTEACSGGGGGKRVLVIVTIGGVEVGGVWYGHLTNIPTTSGAIANGARVGDLAGGLPYNESCWTGPHVHVEPINKTKYSCYTPVSAGQTLGSTNRIGIIGGEYATGIRTTCPSSAYYTGGSGTTAGLRNGGFESGLSPWEKINLTGNVNAAVYSNSSRARSGSGFLEANTSARAGSVGQDTGIVPVPGNYYRARVWARMPAGGTGEITVALWALGGTEENATTTVRVGSAWTPIDVVLAPTRTGHSDLRVELYMATTGVNFNFDDASISTSSTRPSIQPYNPFGHLDLASSSAPGSIRVRGWTIDPNNPTTSIPVHVYVGGRAGASGAQGTDLGNAGMPRPDVANAYPWAGPNHGFERTIATSRTGTVEVCAYGIDWGQGDNALLGCMPVTVPAATAPGPVRSVATTLSGRDATVRWGAPASTGGSAIIGYDVRSTTSPAARRVTSITAAESGLPYDVPVTFEVRAVNAIGAGPWVAAAPVTVPSPLEPQPPTPEPQPAAAGVVPVTPARLLDSRTPAFTIDGRYESTGRRAEGSTTVLEIAGRGGVADDAAGVVLNLTAIRPDRIGYLSVWPCDEDRPNASSLNYVPGRAIAGAAVAALDASGRVCIHTSASTDLAVDVSGWLPSGSVLAPSPPARLVDTRDSGNTIDGRFEGIGRLDAGQVLPVRVHGRGGVVQTATAAALTVTAVRPASNGFVTVFPCDEARPQASTLNFVAGQNIANGLLAKLSGAGQVCVYSSATIDVVIDVTAAMSGTTSVHPLTPARLFESRSAQPTVDGRQAATGRRDAGQVTAVQVAGRGGVAAGADGVLLNVTAVRPSGIGHVTVFPCDEERPVASNLNVVAGQTIANSVLTGIAGDGTVCVFTSVATDLLVDVTASIG